MSRTCQSMVALCGALFALLAPIPLQSRAQAPAAPVANGPARVIVKLKADSALLRQEPVVAGAHEVRRAHALGERLGLAMRSGARLADRTQVVLADGIGSTELALRLAREGDVEYAVPDRRRRRVTAPSDPLYAEGVPGNGPAVGQWYLRAPVGDVKSSLDAERAWGVTTGSANVVVAVLDTGVRFDHPDLPPVTAGGNLLPGYDMISDTPTANDGDGRDADASDPGDWLTLSEVASPGGPFYGCSYFAEDSSWHGTQVAGLIAARTDNGIGMASVGRNVRVLPVRVLGKCGGYDSDIIAGMRWAAGLAVPDVPANTTPARVINMSLGGAGWCPAAYLDAIAEINASGATIVAAAGNTAGHAVGVPANCAGVVAVAALRHVGTKVGFSDLGSEIAISAPGGNCINVAAGSPCLYPILTTSDSGKAGPVGPIYTDSFNASLGTSFSSPLVAGTAALMLSAQPGMTPTLVREVLHATARAFPTTGGDNGDGTPVLQCTAPHYDSLGNPVDQLQCYCTTTTCGAGMLDAGAAVTAALAATPTMPGSGTVVANPYGPLSVQGATMAGDVMTGLQRNVVIYLGSAAGSAGSFAQIDFQGFSIGSGRTLTVFPGAPGQSIVLGNSDALATSIAGTLQSLDGNGAAAPVLYVRNPGGIAVAPGGTVIAASGLTLDTLDSSGSSGASLVNDGVIWSAQSLQLRGARITGGGIFRGNSVVLSTFGNANNPVYGAHFLSNGLQIHPGSGGDVALTLNGYGTTPQVFNVMVNGNASVAMPSAWPAGSNLPPNNPPVAPSGNRPAGTPEPGYGGGSLIVQASGTLSLSGGAVRDFAFPGGIVLKSAGTLDLKGVTVDNGWTTSGQSFQGVFFESPSITDSAGNIEVLTNNLNWVNFSTFPHAPVRSWQLLPAADGSAQFIGADAAAPHLNTYSTLIQAAAAGQCWVCLVNTNPVNMR